MTQRFGIAQPCRNLKWRSPPPFLALQSTLKPPPRRLTSFDRADSSQKYSQRDAVIRNMELENFRPTHSTRAQMLPSGFRHSRAADHLSISRFATVHTSPSKYLSAVPLPTLTGMYGTERLALLQAREYICLRPSPDSPSKVSVLKISHFSSSAHSNMILGDCNPSIIHCRLQTDLASAVLEHRCGESSGWPAPPMVHPMPLCTHVGSVVSALDASASLSS